jgi:hypothetical protein
MSDYIGWLLVGSFICGALAAAAASPRESIGVGFLLGALFGPLGLLAAMAIDGRSKCSQCASRINRGARVCPYCKTARPLDPAAAVRSGNRPVSSRPTDAKPNPAKESISADEALEREWQ